MLKIGLGKIVLTNTLPSLFINIENTYKIWYNMQVGGDNMITLITGATSDLGKKIAEVFAQNNYDLIITYHNDEKKIKNIKKEIESKYNVVVNIEYLELLNKETITKIVDKYNIDILINNAAKTKDEDLLTKSIDDFKEVIDTNILGTFLITRCVGKKMLENKSGSIVNISSTNGIYSNYPESIDYDASKAAINSMTKNFADYFAPYVRVNAIAPGWINTSINKDLNPNFKKEEQEKILLKRFAEPEEIAKTIYNVATDTYINKSIIIVDGGYHA